MVTIQIKKLTMTYFLIRRYEKMQRAWNPHWNVQLNWILLQWVSIIGFLQYLYIVGYDFENFLQTQKFAMTERENAKRHL